MKRRDEPTVVSLESHRRRRQAESRKKPARPPVRAARPPGRERAINWRRAPLFLAALVLFFALSWLLHQVGASLPFH